MGDSCLSAVLKVVNEEEVRLRNREWANVALFVGALAAVVAFVLTRPSDARNHPFFFAIAFSALAIGNVFYTCFAHDRLAEQRVKKYEILFNMKPDKFHVKTRWAYWWSGFWSHLLPFFVAGLAIMGFGMEQLGIDCIPFLAFAVACAAAIIVYFTNKSGERGRLWRHSFFAFGFVAAAYSLLPPGTNAWADSPWSWCRLPASLFVMVAAVAVIVQRGNDSRCPESGV